jgi:epoxyqueuosine reductase
VTAPTSETNARVVKACARELGFDAFAIAAAVPPDPENRLGQWLARGFHADMSWMARTRAIRQDPGLKLPGARSVVVLAKSYYQPRPAPVDGAAKIALYALGRDYHRVLVKPLRQLAAHIAALEPGAACYASVDSGPVLERAWAARAGLGWVGKNSLVLRRDMGSYFFLATILATVELAPDTPVEDHCGACRACIDACPTRAIVESGVVDSRRCISYHTIENRGEIPEGLAPAFGDWLFGCDICQEVCPWNRFARPTNEPDFAPRPGQAHPDPAELADITEPAYKDRFAGTPLIRAKHTGITRNARLVLQNRESS